MVGEGNIIISDESALHALLHSDWASRIETSIALVNPLRECAKTLAGLRSFNVHHPLYGPPPVTLLMKGESARRSTDDLVCRCTDYELPAGSFFVLRDNLYMATPEFACLRMARFKNEVQLAEIGMNLCGRYYIDASGAIRDRTRFLTTPAKLVAYMKGAAHVRRSKKALASLRWVWPNSGSPYETKMKLLFCHPPGRGGFGLPFMAMNYDVRAGRLQRIMAQAEFSIDMADPRRKVGMEYDGGEYHLDASKDKRRRNELEALGWTLYPIDKQVLGDAGASIRAAEQIAKLMGVRLRRSAAWEGKYLRLRGDLGLRT